MIWHVVSFQPYERMNVADALVPRTYDDGDLIIRQVRNFIWSVKISWDDFTIFCLSVHMTTEMCIDLPAQFHKLICFWKQIDLPPDVNVFTTMEHTDSRGKPVQQITYKLWYRLVNRCLKTIGTSLRGKFEMLWEDGYDEWEWTCHMCCSRYSVIPTSINMSSIVRFTRQFQWCVFALNCFFTCVWNARLSEVISQRYIQ